MTRFSQHGAQPMGADRAQLSEALVVIGGSAGSLPPLRQIVAELPGDLPAAVLVAIHRSERTPSHLAEILSRDGPLPAAEASDGEPIRRGRIYVAPPGRHLMSGYGRIRLSGAPRVNRHRPAIDVLFASAARWSADRTVAVVLSGVLDDGAVGAALVAAAGGRVLVQEPKEADFANMPAAALAAAPGARPLPVADLAGGVLDEVETMARSENRPAPHIHGTEAGMDMPDSDDPGFLSEPETKLTRLVCPECGGALAQVDLAQISYFRCHIGHQYAPQTLAAAQAETAEAKLWSAVAALEEQAAFQHYLGNLGSTRPGQSAVEYARSADRTAERATVLREQVRQWMAEAAATEPAAG
jgi:two-component system chemotaxis response regulator CheB